MSIATQTATQITDNMDNVNLTFGDMWVF